ncbi:MAG TPA: hypothetical protein VHP55_11980 [Usitatibacter sp.]|jgi:hypothetical protein|nr:hypothetical protein [Usitatibacter sp.]
MLARDAELIDAIVSHHGYDRTLMVTLTFRHWSALRLAPLRKGLANSFRWLQRHRQWKQRDCMQHARIIRALEVTSGEHGWHPHLHVLLLLAAPLSTLAMKSFDRMVSGLWREGVGSTMGLAYRPTREYGVDVSRCHKADYIAKLGLEVADAGQSKRARNVKGESFWQMRSNWLAQQVRRIDDPRALRIREYIEAMRGARIVTWSHGMREEAEALAPKEDLVERECATLHAEEWDAVRDRRTEDGRDARAAILRAAENAPPGEVDGAVRGLVDELLTHRPRC